MQSPVGTSLVNLIIRLISFCMLPLLLAGGWLAYQSVRTAQTDRDWDAANLVQGFISSIDSQLNARIGALQVLAASPLTGDEAHREELYREAQGYFQTFGNHVLLADVEKPMRMLFNTRVPFGTELPLLPQPESNPAAPRAVETGRPAVGDSFFGPIAGQRLVAVAVPVLRGGKAVFLLLSLFEARQFQTQLDKVSLPTGWSLTLTDGRGEVLVQRSDVRSGGAGEPARVTAKSTVSHWSAVLEIPPEIYQAPLVSAAAALGVGLLSAAALSLVGGISVGRRIARAVASLAKAPALDSPVPQIREIADARRRLDEAENRRSMADATRRESEEKLRLFIEHAPAALAMFDRNMRYVAASRRWMTDYRLKGEVLGHSHYEIFPEIPEHWKEVHLRGLNGEVVKCDEEAFVRADGATQWLLWEVRPWYAGDGAVGGIVIFTEDITERKLWEKALVKSEQQVREINQLLEAILCHTHMMVVYLDTSFNFIWVNRAYADTCNHEPSFFPGKNHFELYPHEENRAIFQRVVTTGEPFFVTYKPFEFPDQPERGVTYWDWSLVPVKDPDSRTAGLVFTLVEVTEKKRAEERRLEIERQHLEAQKLETVGVLAGGIAHDFNNLLGIVVGGIELTLMQWSSSEHLRQVLEEALKASLEARVLIRQLLAYAGKGHYLPRRINLNELVTEKRPLFRSSISKSVHLNVMLDPDELFIQADPSSIGQVILNLVVNASEAYEDKEGSILIRTGSQICDDSYLCGSRIEEKPPAGPYVYIEVSDGGRGMDEEASRRLFDPFFTTKLPGRGLGMAAVKGIVQWHKGAIFIKSDAAKGTTVRVVLPALKE